MQNLKPILQSNKFLSILFVLTFLWCLLNFSFSSKSTIPLNTPSIKGKIIAFKIDGNFLSITVDAKEKVQAFYYFDSLEEKEKVEESLGHGKNVWLEGTLQEPSSASIPHTFDYKKYLSYQKIYRTMNAEKIKISDGGNIFEQIKTKVYKYISHFQNKDYLLALLLGNTTYLDVTAIQNNGISHLFAISGMHISLFATLLRKIVRKFGKKGDIVICFFLLFYAFLVGFTPSVMRSVFLFIFLFLNDFFHLKLSKMRIFLYTFIFLLFLNPFNLMNLGFQYSFLICFTFFFLKSSKKYWKNLVKTSTIAFLVSIPISAIHFFEINILSIVWNIFFVPFVTFVMYPLCFFVVFFPFIEGLFTIVIQLFEGINTWCQTITVGVIVIPYIFSGLWVIFYLFILNFLRLGKKKYLLLALLFFLCVKTWPKINTNAYMYFIDVGQGDSSLFISPHQKEIILIDTGGKINYRTEEWEKRQKQVKLSDTLKTFLYSLGISKIDNLIITHGDYDHMGEASDLIKHFTVKQVVFNQGEYNQLEKEFIKELEKKNIKYTQNVNQIILRKNTLYFLNDKLYKDENDNSIVIYTEYNGVKFLLMGDAGSTVESSILENPILEKIDFLKVGHHGSNTSTSKSFVNTIKPRNSIISVGKNNRYGHPASEVIENLKNTNIYRTDKDGTIKIKMKKGKTSIKTYSS